MRAKTNTFTDQYFRVFRYLEFWIIVDCFTWEGYLEEFTTLATKLFADDLKAYRFFKINNTSPRITMATPYT
jgi:hypothetical protein